MARYSEQFEATAVKLSRLPEVLIRDVESSWRAQEEAA